MNHLQMASTARRVNAHHSELELTEIFVGCRTHPFSIFEKNTLRQLKGKAMIRLLNEEVNENTLLFS